jgi:hypothetical protein
MKMIKSLGMDNNYQAQDDVRTLVRASEIQKDKKRFKAAMKYAQDQIESLEDLDPVADAKEDAATGEKDD